jgi:hypothetical protein
MVRFDDVDPLELSSIGNHGGGVFAWGGKVCEKAQMTTKRYLCQRKTVGELEESYCKPVEQEENHEKGPRGSWAGNHMGNIS